MLVHVSARLTVGGDPYCSKGAKDTRPRTRRRKAEIVALRQTASAGRGMEMGPGMMHPGMMGKGRDFGHLHGTFAHQ